ncbi:DUF2530 domain-containing protein [Streptomyces sp. NA04227]|uniref:DUF2530 domain-containing protein n=1 Tax=Streptomyces sp. NA04227 TaxID=2742136 RepID=UPI0015914D89|nr:DUF2530 domain-containing protein [Streptomyces sp. NA04227]QKW07222.1 DUF2530 domain-containing protein [Streptomyces sp. NA04227]
MTRETARRPLREAPAPLEGPVVGTVTGGTILWFLLFLAQLPFYGWFDDHGHLWWVWTPLAGAGLGLIGIWYVRGREAALKRAESAAETPDGETPTGETPADEA